MTVILNIKMLYTEFVGKFINTSIYTKSHVPQPIGLTVIAINVEAKETHRLPCCFKFSIQLFPKFLIFLEDTLQHNFA
jgi:hypothetical protein